MLLNFPDKEPFATGASTYDYRQASKNDRLSRIFVDIEIQGSQTSLITPAVLDTGGAYLICPPDISTQLRLDPSDAYIRENISIRGTRILGSLRRLNITFLAMQGENTEIEAIVFIPDPEQVEEWTLPP